LFRIGVSDKKPTGSYSVTVDAVATRAYASRSTTGYSMTLVP